MKLPEPNPVLVRELRQRMRGPRAPVVLTLYLGLLVLILYLSAQAALNANRGFQCINGNCFPTGGPDILSISTAGRAITHLLILLMLIGVCMIVPALGAGAIAGERERRTLTTLQLTLMTPRSIVVGKMLASLAFVAFLLVATIPLFTVAFWMGGALLADILKGLAMVLVTAVVVAALGLFASAYLRRSLGATVIAYGLVFLLTAGTFGVYGAQEAWRSLQPDGRGQPTSPMVLVLNPFVATADVLGGTPGAAEALPSPFTGIRGILLRHHFRAGPRAFPVQGGLIAPEQHDLRGPRFPYWARSLVAFTLLTLVLLWLTAYRLRTPTRRPEG